MVVVVSSGRMRGYIANLDSVRSGVDRAVVIVLSHEWGGQRTRCSLQESKKVSDQEAQWPTSKVHTYSLE